MPGPLLNFCFLYRWALRVLIACLLALPLVASAPAQSSAERPSVLLVVGAPGEEEYAGAFKKTAEIWKANCEAAKAPLTVVGLDEASTNDLEQVQSWFAQQPASGPELWVVLHGHGTYDNREGKFNVRGPDLSSATLARLLEPFSRPVILVLGFSSSAGFLPKVSGKDRVVLSATRSPSEINYTRFGDYFAETVISAEGDLDKDGQTSVLEAFLMASRRVAEFYENAGRLMTEHALIDDNGDAAGTPPDFFKGTRAARKAAGSKAVDGSRARQLHLLPVEAEREMPLAWRQKRDALEFTIEQLRGRKAAMDAEVYYKELETVLLELAALYAELPEGAASEGEK